MASGTGFLDGQLSEKTSFLGLKLWVVVCLWVGAFIILVLFFVSLWLSSRRGSAAKKTAGKNEGGGTFSIPAVSKEIEVDECRRGGKKDGAVHGGYGLIITDTDDPRRGIIHQQQRGSSRFMDAVDINGEKGRQKLLWEMVSEEARSDASSSRCDGEKAQEADYYEAGAKTAASLHNENKGGFFSEFEDDSSRVSSGTASALHHIAAQTMQDRTVSDVSRLGWGQWYSLRDLELATAYFSDSNVVGEGGYGIVYKGQMEDGSFIAVKHLLNNRGQAEREFRVEVEAIGRVRHKHLVRLIGYCAEGSHRMLVYEFMENGNLDQWLHGKLGEGQPIPWEGRMKIALGTAKGLAYLHEGLEPKVVHRDIKSSNILLDNEWNPKVSDFGLAKLLGTGKSFVTTRVMGTFGYVAPEYASTGLLNERSDVYSYGVLLMEVVTGRDPVDYGRPNGEVNLVEWLKAMVSSGRSGEVVDPRLEAKMKPSSRALKRALLVALRCVDPDAQKRPKMGQVVHMLEMEEDEKDHPDDHRGVRSSSQRVVQHHRNGNGKEER